MDFCGISDEPTAIEEKHCISPAVENTETWCVAAREPDINNIESLKKDELACEYLNRLNGFSGKRYGKKYLKDQKKRAEYCRGHINNIKKIEESCTHYLKTITQIIDIVPK
ncbi:hypothetical protein ACMS1Z_15060 [Acidiphilium multivorum]|uniref:hypothetical protein n=1 Tax=Acidiphilium multivorum TaxID=62140 RepID=UPI0039C99722